MPRARMPLTWVALLCVPVLACGDEGGTTPAPPPAPAYDISIINGVGYRSDSNATQNPAVDTVAAGTKVRWTWQNTGTVAHNVRSAGSPSFPGSGDLNTAGSTFTYTFTTPGTYNYECTMPGHAAAGMTGTLVVQ
ncbi:MAG TPA: plastocyanin/azurin family copper-binding protein [Gemmatimonadales bacterium]|nr:plastocyanin/azurin family copper-binding protein [Gemmatimonadales bacterium]